MDGNFNAWPRLSSSWWKDIFTLEDFGRVLWSNSEVVRCVGNGRKTSFWNDTCRCEVSFRDKYPRLFSISNQKEESIGELCGENSLGEAWNFIWWRRLFVWEEQLLEDLRDDLVGFRLGEDEDGWRWRLEEDGRFSIKSSYEKLEGLVVSEDVWGEEARRKRCFLKFGRAPLLPRWWLSLESF